MDHQEDGPADSSQRRAPPRRARAETAQAVLVGLLVVGLLIAIFVLQNTARTKVSFLFWSATVPLAGALLLAAVLGGILAFLVAFARQRGVVKAERRRTDRPR